MNNQQQNQVVASQGATMQSGARMAAMVPSDDVQLIKMSEMLAGSSLIPRDFQGRPGDIAVCIMKGMEIGLSPMQALDGIAVVNGRATLWGDAVPALVYGQNKGHKIEERFEGEGDSLTAVCIVTRGDTGSVHEQRFSVQDAKTAKLWGKTGKNGQPTPWVQYPKRMLQMRARAWAIRDATPDALKGFKVAEEVQDYAEAPLRDVTPQQPSPAAVARGQGEVRAIPTAKPAPATVDVMVTTGAIEPQPQDIDGSNQEASQNVQTSEQPDNPIPDMPPEFTGDQGQVWEMILDDGRSKQATADELADNLISAYGGNGSVKYKTELQQRHAEQVKIHPRKDEILEAFVKGAREPMGEEQ